MAKTKQNTINVILEDKGCFEYEKGISLERIADNFVKSQCQIVALLWM